MAEAKFDQVEYYKHDEMLKLDFLPPKTGWMDTPVDFRPGSF